MVLVFLHKTIQTMPLKVKNDPTTIFLDGDINYREDNDPYRVLILARLSNMFLVISNGQRVAY